MSAESWQSTAQSTVVVDAALLADLSEALEAMPINPSTAMVYDVGRALILSGRPERIIQNDSESFTALPADDERADGHAANCDGWHHPLTGHCGDCGCFTCSAER